MPRRASSSSRRPTSGPASSRSSPRDELTADARHGLGLPADCCSARSRSTARPIGTAAISAIRRSSRCFYDRTADDVLLVQINPIERASAPRSSHEIHNRLNEITFNASLLSELRAIDFVTRLIDHGKLPRGTGPGEYRRINLHRIALDHDGLNYTAASRRSNEYDFLKVCMTTAAAPRSAFLDEHFDDIGVRSTVDLRPEFQAVVE